MREDIGLVAHLTRARSKDFIEHAGIGSEVTRRARLAEARQGTDCQRDDQSQHQRE